jgi:hypothetical protein
MCKARVDTVVVQDDPEVDLILESFGRRDFGELVETVGLVRRYWLQVNEAPSHVF